MNKSLWLYGSIEQIKCKGCGGVLTLNPLQMLNPKLLVGDLFCNATCYFTTAIGHKLDLLDMKKTKSNMKENESEQERLREEWHLALRERNDEHKDYWDRTENTFPIRTSTDWSQSIIHDLSVS
jgi:hypothetical protein